MTLPSQGKKLTQNEIDSIQIAMNDVGIRAIHPEKMEAFAEYLVRKIENQNYDQSENYQQNRTN